MDKRNSVDEEITEKVLIDDFAKENGLKILYRSDNEYITFSTVTINRPGLLLAGFSDYFENTRIQAIGNAETYYLKSLSVENRIEALDKLFSQKVPCVIVDVMRQGPNQGVATLPAQGDLMQSAYGSHGDRPVITLAPNSVEETYTETIRAFNLAQKYRTPVVFAGRSSKPCQ